MEKIKVGDLMTRSFIHTSPETTLIECSKIMLKKRVGSLILRENDELKGLLTERDILWVLTKKNKDINQIRAKDIATKKIITINPNASLEKAFYKMKKSNFKWLPVVSKKKVVGMLTIKDLLFIRPDLQSEIEDMKIREEAQKLKRIEGLRREGLCDECGEMDDALEEIGGRLVCEDCKEKIL